MLQKISQNDEFEETQDEFSVLAINWQHVSEPT